MITPMTAARPPARHLIHDEVEEFYSGTGAGIEARIRIWRGRDVAPVVLVSQSGKRSNWRVRMQYTCRIGNYIHHALLRYPDLGMVYFEDGANPNGECVLNQVFFEYQGNVNRPVMCLPARQAQPWTWLEFIVGREVER